MPIHDWTRLSPNDFHDFHQGWIGNIRSRLNQGILPDSYYALIEQIATEVRPGVMVLQSNRPETERNDQNIPSVGKALSVAEAPPQVALTMEFDRRFYAELKSRVAIYHASDDRVVGFVEFVASGNKQNDREFDKLMERIVSALEQGIHMLIVDIQARTTHDPQGIHGAICSVFGGTEYIAPPNKSLTQAAYVASLAPRAYVEPCSVGDRLTSMPLFLTPTHYVPVPLDESYMLSFGGIPRHLQQVLEEAR